MNSHPQRRISQLAFTLVELLTVITIIAILMGLLFPAIGIVKEQARKAEAKSAASQTAAAVKQYYAEYGKYPIGSQTPPANTDLLYGTGGGAKSNELLFNILRNLKSGDNPYVTGSTTATIYNPRAIVFFEGKAASDPNNPKGGFDSNGTFFDPWGKQYCIAIDADYDNQITNLPYADFGTTSGPRTGVAVYSLGKDGIVGSSDTNGKYRDATKTSDDIVTWQ